MMRLRFLAAAAALSATPIGAITVRRGEGSPPCSTAYHGSGDPSATPAPGSNPLPTPNPSHTVFPGCMCPGNSIESSRQLVGMGGGDGGDGNPWAGIPDGDVEILTVDTRLANKVRCDNVSVAQGIANMLRIPVKRLSVSPWSWTLDVPQPTYLAFVQEEHERCDCKSEDGKVLHGQGFRTVATKASSDGQSLSPHTTVMTVSQYKAMMGKASGSSAPPAPAPKPAKADGKGGAPPAPPALPGSPAPPPPPASRVQMLTRDPCLVHVLRTQTKHFAKEIAYFLGVPTDKIILDPPAVKGTVGLLQLDTSLESEKEMRQAPVLALQHCSAPGVKAAEERLRLQLLENHNASIAAAASPMTYSVATPNTTNSTNLTATSQRISLVMKLSNIHYDLLAQSWALVSSFTTTAKTTIAMAAGMTSGDIDVALYPGSVVVEAKITPPPGMAQMNVMNALNGSVCNQFEKTMNAFAGLDQAKTGTIECEVLSLELEDPPFPEHESNQTNRAWIAFWSVVIEEPFAEEGAWRLLNLVNTPMTEIAKLLPMTVARVPGLNYRALQEPNLANETRLPPPIDRAVGFSLPNPYREEAAMEAQRRAQREKEDEQMRQENEDRAKAQSAVINGQQAARMIKQADTKFISAARAHALTIRGGDNAMKPPDIVPYEVLPDPSDPEDLESPYPWQDQNPPPRISMVQAPQQHSQQLRGVQHGVSRHA